MKRLIKNISLYYYYLHIHHKVVGNNGSYGSYMEIVSSRWGRLEVNGVGLASIHR